MPKEPIQVSKKIIADVGRGIYRTPANALKEIVSNAFDACASWVKITTNAPYFDIFTCEDNGEGMGFDEFKIIMKRIGSSSKRAQDKTVIDCNGNLRPIIGKIGIGLLSISQICNNFTIYSKKKNTDKFFEAKIDLLQFDKDEAYLSGEGDIQLGEYEIDEIEASEEYHPLSYTKITIESLKSGFKKILKGEYHKQIKKPGEFVARDTEFSKFIKELYNLKDFKNISSYDRMIWELGLICPIKYYDTKVIFPSEKYIKDDIERLKHYNFTLIVDGLEIFKPIVFTKNNRIRKVNDDYKIYTLPKYEKSIEGEILKFHGYIYTQREKIKPTDLQGILIRIGDVAIGNYDKTVLKYPREEGPIFGMISGEVFVEQGLENALNIDRNSFNETHPHYQELKLHLHNFIKNTVTKDIRERSKKRRKRERKSQITEEFTKLSDYIRKRLDINIKIEIREETKDQHYIFDENKKKLTFFTKTKGWSKSEKERIGQMKAIVALVVMKILKEKSINENIFHEIVFGGK